MMACPLCEYGFEPVTTVRGIAICPRCFASLVVRTGARATAADTMPLDVAEMRELKALRAQMRAEKEVKA